MQSDHNPNKRKHNMSWAKHLRPFMKRKQNQRLRRLVDKEIRKEQQK